MPSSRLISKFILSAMVVISEFAVIVEHFLQADFRVVIVGISVSKHSNYWQILDKQLYWQGRLASVPVVCVL
jgi:hypothetical protein